MAGGSKNHRRILGREPWSAAQKRSWGRKTRRALQLAPLFVSLDRADAIIEGARYIVPGADTWLLTRHLPMTASCAHPIPAPLHLVISSIAAISSALSFHPIASVFCSTCSGFVAPAIMLE